MNSIEDEIRNNLYEFYDQISLTGGIYTEKEDNWSVIRNISGAWPSLIYRVDTEIVGQKSATIFAEKINSATYPEILIVSDENIQQIDPFLRAQGFFPFSAWKGMAFRNVEVITSPFLPETIQIVRPESLEDIEQWLKIVNSELVAPARMDKILLESLIVQPEFEAFLLKFNGVGVSTILAFKSASSTGLYLIATDKSAQRQGFAGFLVQQIVSQNVKMSNNPMILHATSKGEPLYSKLGFSPFNQFFLYRFLNSEL